MNIFRKCVVRMGNSVWRSNGDGKWHDLGLLTPSQVDRYCAEHSLPLLSVRLSLPGSPVPYKAPVEPVCYTDPRGVVARY